jgi:hypothetical protein
MSNCALSFIEYYKASFKAEADQKKAYQLFDEVYFDFIYYTPITLELLEASLNAGHIDYFYKSIADLKYLIEFSDDFSRYWHLLRAYSGALSKLKANQSVKSSKKIYYYYFARYGERRFLRNEHWFEKKRWEFLDELQSIYSEDALENFILKYQRILIENLKIYVSFLMAFTIDLKNSYKPDSVATMKINS